MRFSVIVLLFLILFSIVDSEKNLLAPQCAECIKLTKSIGVLLEDEKNEDKCTSFMNMVLKMIKIAGEELFLSLSDPKAQLLCTNFFPVCQQQSNLGQKIEIGYFKCSNCKLLLSIIYELLHEPLKFFSETAPDFFCPGQRESCTKKFNSNISIINGFEDFFAKKNKD
ncbi:unnamed protein product [Auanema sp. JU1783]|nr:unnamed protein product [Auanema sp. JU1783]